MVPLKIPSNLQHPWRKKLQISIGGILMWSLLLGQYGAEGDYTVAIASKFLNLKNKSTLNVDIGTTTPYRIIWRNSSVSQNTLPTDDATILIQWATNGVITCQDGDPDQYGNCGKFGMNVEYGLVFNNTDFTDSDQKFWCDVSARDGFGNDNVVPEVSDSGRTELTECKDNMCKLTCTATRFTPDTNFNLTWKIDGDLLQMQPPELLRDGNYFTTSSNLSTTEYQSGNYSCCTSGDAYFFSKEICNYYDLQDPKSPTLEKWEVIVIAAAVIGFAVLVLVPVVVVIVVSYRKKKWCFKHAVDPKKSSPESPPNKGKPGSPAVL